MAGSARAREGLAAARLDLVWREVLDPRGDGPHVAEGVGYWPEAVAPELVLGLLVDGRAGFRRRADDGVDVGDVQEECDGRSPELRRRPARRLREPVRE